MFSKNDNYLGSIVAVGFVLVMIVLVISVNWKNVDSDILSVSGTSEVTVMPDQAKLSVSTVTLADSASSAQSDNSKSSNAVIDALRAKGVKDSDIQTTDYSLYKKTEWNDKEQKYITLGYEARHSVEVKTTDLDIVGELLDAAVNAGANEVGDVVFELTKDKEKEVKSLALAKAAGDARVKAESLAKESGVRLGKVKTVSESSVYVPYYNSRINMAADASIEKAIIQPREVNVQASVGMVYEIK